MALVGVIHSRYGLASEHTGETEVSTRATIEIKDGRETFTVYRHMDGYPDTEHGIVETLYKALPYAWPLPRFEASDFAAALVCGWKTGGGDIRVSRGRDAHGDTEWHYVVEMHGNRLMATVFERGPDDEWIEEKTCQVKGPVRRRVVGRRFSPVG